MTGNKCLKIHLTLIVFLKEIRQICFQWVKAERDFPGQRYFGASEGRNIEDRHW
jgi:hypothetical protein